MINTVLAKVFGTANERAVKRLLPALAQINTFEDALKSLSDTDLQAKTPEFRARIAQALGDLSDPEQIIATRKAILDDLLPEAFAVTREAARRVIGMRHYDVQLIGGIVLHSGKIAEMKNRRRQDPGRHASLLPECARRSGRSCRHRQRLPGQARR